VSRLVYTLLSLLLICSCQENESKPPLFQLLDNEDLGIDFINQLKYDRDFNVYRYRNYYNGGGVALGDVNNDGWLDIYFTANLESNRLYVSHGDGSYVDMTKQAGVEGQRAWSTGVTMVDINADGFLDIYVCNSGDISGDNKENELFINNGDLTFTESAASYGLNDSGFSTHASFFDFDKDGDLDVYLLNNSYQAIGSFNLRIDERPKRDVKGGDKLLRNDLGLFSDVSEQAGIYGSVIGFGLGITVGDVNNDMWEDIYVSNDFFERDYLYLNNQNGTFSEVLTDQIKSISGASMGADMADIDNDGNVDLFVTEMLPSDPERLKTVTTFEDWNRYQYNLNNGYHHQFTRNTLQKNNADSTFSEVGRYAGVEASDWSWGALFFDMDNDGLRDLFIANGIYQDLTNQDYLQYIANEQVIESIITEEGVNYKELIDVIPSNAVANHFYLNLGDIKFERQHSDDIDIGSFSNGSAYGDLDNDGDLDLVVNNVNMPPMIYENQSDLIGDHNYIQINLKGRGDNINAIGSRILITCSDGKELTYDLQPAKGFQSSVDIKSTIGIGMDKKVDIQVTWPDSSVSILDQVEANQLITIDIVDALDNYAKEENALRKKIFKRTESLNFEHTENAYSDFNRERLIYHMKSNLGPDLFLSDLDNNGQTDLVVSGSKGGLSTILLNKIEGQAITLSNALSLDKEQSCIHVFDANQDGLQDIYVASGGTDVSPFSPSLFDELWLNLGESKFKKTDQLLPNQFSNISTSVVLSNDIDGDGDLDLMIGERVKIGSYGAVCSGFLLKNDGAGNFEDVTEQWGPNLQNVGMISDAQFYDLTGDGIDELIVVGEFMEPKMYRWNGKKYVPTFLKQFEDLSGWYNTIHICDVNGDNKGDLILGNHGANSKFRASKSNPIKLYFKDFDNNGFAEGIMTYQDNRKDYPYALRHNLIEQLKYLKKKFPDYESYKRADINMIFSKEELHDVKILSIQNLETLLFINKGDLQFDKISLPKEVQYTPIFAITSGDYDRDGDVDLILGGNQYNVLPEAGIYDASYGVYLENDGDGNFISVPARESGFKVEGQVRSLITTDSTVLIGLNNDALLTYDY